jgi:NADPH2:quinone reductase
MKAIQIKQYGGEEQLEMVEVPIPQAGAGQVVVRIVATSFNLSNPIARRAICARYSLCSFLSFRR